MIYDDELKLRNGAKPIAYHTWAGGRLERKHLGLVLAKAYVGNHPYVTWQMVSDDGKKWDCYAGHYCESLTEGFRSFKERRKAAPKNG
tara:strand:+ start:1147 stop:1410 length:264 start_codon:yes stop_codon:yes gene_type:complete